MTRTSPFARALFALAALLLVVGLTTRTPSAAATDGARSPAPAEMTTAAEAHASAGHIEFAPPADTLVRLTQPDGTTLGATLTPAEVGGTLEVGGYSVAKGDDGWWRFVTGRSGTGDPVLAAARAGVDRRPADLAVGAARTTDTHALSSAEANMLRQLQIASREASIQAAQDGGIREFRFPVVLFATWYDTDAGQSAPQFQEGNDADHFRAILDGFGGNPTGTLTEFYFENSYGQFLVIVDVLAQPDGSPYVSLRSGVPGDEGRCYYGGIDPPPDLLDDLDPIDNVLGVGGGGALGMAVEVMNTTSLPLDHQFAPYDNDGDGSIDFMGIVHSGPEMAVSGDPCHTWSHAIAVSSLTNLPVTLIEELAGLDLPDALDIKTGLPVPLQTVTYDRLFTMPEFETADGILTIGVAAHEMAHALGEPDYYGTDGSTSGSGNWDVMAGGSYGGTPSGSNPMWFNPASRVFQGWVTPTIVHEDQLDVELEGRSHQPFDGYAVGTPNPNLILVPTRWIDVGDTTEEDGHTWTRNDVYGLPLDDDNGYVLEGWYLEYVDRMPVRADAIHPDMTRESYFDRWAYGSGLLTWHFDYWRRSNVLHGQNGGNNDANRMQMDVEEWDFNDNTQEIGLNQSRSESSDVACNAATGLTSGTHRSSPGTAAAPAGDPQDDMTIPPGPVTPLTPYDFEFVVDDNPANRTMQVTISGPGDCTLQMLSGESGAERDETGVVDAGFVGAEEQATITDPRPGRWVARIGDFAGCLSGSGVVEFRSSDAFDATGTADTWSNATQEPTGWAFTNIRTGDAEGLAHGADAAQVDNLTLDVLNLSEVADVSPGFAQAAPTDALDGRGVITAGTANPMAVEIFSNGGVSAGSVDVEVREGAAGGPVVASGSVDTEPYASALFTFDYTPTIEGGFELFTVVDPAGAVAEGSEANNVQKSSGWAGPAGPVVLIVDDDAVTDSEQLYAGSLAALGIPYAIATKHVTPEMMDTYEAVIWVGGLSRGEGQLDDQDRASIADHLDGGGNLWLASNRAVEALTAGGHTDFLDTYFGVNSIGIDSFYDVVDFETTDFFNGVTFGLDALPGRPFLDEYAVTGDGESLGTLNGSGRAGDGVAVLGARLIGDGFRTVTTAFGVRQVTDPAGAIDIVDAVMADFEVATGQYKVSTEDPVVYHSPPWQSRSGVEVPLRAIVLGGEGTGQPVQAFYRRHGLGEFVTIDLAPSGDQGAHAGVIPADEVTPDGLDYYLKAGSASTYVPRLAEGGSVTNAVAVFFPEGSSTLVAAGPGPGLPATPVNNRSTLPATGGVPMLLAAGVIAALGLLVRRTRRTA